MRVLAVIAVLALAGCMTRQPGGEWPYVSHSEARDDVMYHGVGVRF
jgi:hypothetical protein